MAPCAVVDVGVDTENSNPFEGVEGGSFATGEGASQKPIDGCEHLEVERVAGFDLTAAATSGTAPIFIDGGERSDFDSTDSAAVIGGVVDAVGNLLEGGVAFTSRSYCGAAEDESALAFDRQLLETFSDSGTSSLKRRRKVCYRMENNRIVLVMGAADGNERISSSANRGCCHHTVSTLNSFFFFFFFEH